MAGLLDDLGKGIMNAASEAVTGMSNEERDKLVEKMMGGNMDFNDYFKMTLMMQSQGGVGGIMSSVNNVPGLKQTLGMDDTNVGEAEAKLEQYSKIIAAMSEEEREQPGYFLVGEGASARISAFVEKSELEQAVVEEFFEQFRKMKTFFTKMGAGVRQGKSRDQVAKEMEQEAKAEEAKAKSAGQSAPKNQPFVNPERKLKKLQKRKAASGRKPPPPLSSGARAQFKRPTRR